MGRVWRAEGPGGPAALKILGVDRAEVRERFELEARALMKLRHPNVVRAIDYGHAEDGTPFIALDCSTANHSSGASSGSCPARRWHEAGRGRGARPLPIS